jgi:hypothetical protein
LTVCYRFDALPGEQQRSLILQKMLRREQVRPLFNTGLVLCLMLQQGLKDNAFFLKGLCDEVSKLTPGYSGKLPALPPHNLP